MIERIPDNDLAAKEALWMFQQGWIRGVRERGAQRVFEDTQGIGKIKPKGRHRYLGCIDERIGGKHIGVAGSGILWGVELTAEAVALNGITQISSHKHCQAATNAVMSMYGNLTGGDLERAADEYAETFARAVAERAGISYGGHVCPSDFGHPTESHNTGVIYYTDIALAIDETELPPGFLVSRLKETPIKALNDVSLAVTIAQGDHGFGGRLSGETPAMLIGISDTPRQAEILGRELMEVQTRFGLDKVAVDTVVLG